MGWLLAVHIGAGRYGETADGEAQYAALLRSALKYGKQQMEGEQDADCAVSRAVRVASGVLSVLERSELTNCGHGSNLTADGVVECEASVACGSTRAVGACAAVAGVAEPSSLARALLRSSLSLPETGIGREPPLVLVGDGARKYVRSLGIETARDGEELRGYQVTAQAKRQWRQWHERITKEQADGNEDEDQRLDTVGAICVDPEGNVAAALSSGGVLYKVPGRVGLAGCPRVGCDARNAAASTSNTTENKKTKRRRDHETANGFAIACTGRGEQFIRSAFVATLAQRLRRSSAEMDDALRSSFEDAMDDNGGEPLEGGAMALTLSPVAELPLRRQSKRQRRHAKSAHGEPNTNEEPAVDLCAGERTVQLGVAFTTPCMGVGYLHHKSSQPHVEILRQPRKKKQHLVVHVSHFAV